jgi:hypothetical protein
VRTLYLGTHRPTWLRLGGPPLMVSRNTMPTRTLPVAVVPWVLDSGGFTELSLHGGWRIGATVYAALVQRYVDEIGRLVWAAPQDWMCEPVMLERTGLTVAEHQRRTTANLLDLRTIDATLPIVPVLQGWTLDDYQRHADDYDRAGVDLCAEATVGVGSVCRRQDTDEAVAILSTLCERGLRLHGFGLKAKGIAKAWPYLASADSLAWSYDARRVAARGVCCRRMYRGRPIRSCANCRHYALDWYRRASGWAQPLQGQLW